MMDLYDLRTSYEISEDLYLTVAPVQGKTQSARATTDHVVVVDCSGSMWGDLPRVRQHVKTALPGLMGEGDTLTLIWFSGRGEAGIVFEGEEARDGRDLQRLGGLVDRWLKPMGLTGFQEPLELAKQALSRLSGESRSLIFMSDGCDNQCDRSRVVVVARELAPLVNRAAFVEYGQWADRPLLCRLADATGGQHVMADGFREFTDALDHVVSAGAPAGSRTTVDADAAADDGRTPIAVGRLAGDPVTLGVVDGEVDVPAGVESISFLETSPSGVVETLRLGASTAALDSDFLAHGYLLAGALAMRGHANLTTKVLGAIGDVWFVKEFANAFGKQKFADLASELERASSGTGHRFRQGRDTDCVPPDDAATVLDVIDVLDSDGKCRLLLDHPEWDYRAISRRSVPVDAKAKLTELAEKLAKADPKNVQEIRDEMAAVDPAGPLVFTADPAPNGHPITGVTYSSKRANVSVQVVIPGTVDLSGRVPPALQGALPDTVETRIVRNYAVVADGIVNLPRLPVMLSATARARLDELGVPIRDAGKGVSVIELDRLPVVNRRDCTAPSADETARLIITALRLKAVQKVLNARVKDQATKAAGLADRFGADAAKWLSDRGVRDYGFSPVGMTQVPATDAVRARELECRALGLASLPAIDAVRKALAKRDEARAKGRDKRLTPGQTIVSAALGETESLDDAAAVARLAECRRRLREIDAELGRRVMAVVVGNVWFREFESVDDGDLTLDIDGAEFRFEMRTREVEIPI